MEGGRQRGPEGTDNNGQGWWPPPHDGVRGWESPRVVQAIVTPFSASGIASLARTGVDLNPAARHTPCGECPRERRSVARTFRPAGKQKDHGILRCSLRSRFICALASRSSPRHTTPNGDTAKFVELLTAAALVFCLWPRVPEVATFMAGRWRLRWTGAGATRSDTAACFVVGGAKVVPAPIMRPSRSTRSICPDAVRGFTGGRRHRNGGLGRVSSSRASAVSAPRRAVHFVARIS